MVRLLGYGARLATIDGTCCNSAGLSAKGRVIWGFHLDLIKFVGQLQKVILGGFMSLKHLDEFNFQNQNPNSLKKSPLEPKLKIELGLKILWLLSINYSSN